jgi:hypothetical protein
MNPGAVFVAAMFLLFASPFIGAAQTVLQEIFGPSLNQHGFTLVDSSSSSSSSSPLSG